MAEAMRPARIALLTLVVGAFFTGQEFLGHVVTGHTELLWEDVRAGGEFWIVWAPLTPIVSAALSRWPPLAKPLWVPALAHTAIAALLGVLQWVLLITLRTAPAIWRGTPLLTALHAQRAASAFVDAEFAGAAFYATIVMVYIGLRFRGMYIAEQLGAAELKAELTQSKLDALRSQLRPHFLFNALSAISVFVTEDAEKAQRMLLGLSALLRRSLDEEANEVSLEQELRFVSDYLDIQRARFSDQLEVRLDVAPDVLRARVPVLLLQPLFENAIEHGLWDRTEKRTTIVLTASRENGTLLVSVTDDGPGPPAGGPRERIGLGNTRARLEHLYGDGATLDLHSGNGAIACGTHVAIRIPLVMA